MADGLDGRASIVPLILVSQEAEKGYESASGRDSVSAVNEFTN